MKVNSFNVPIREGSAERSCSLESDYIYCKPKYQNPYSISPSEVPLRTDILFSGIAQYYGDHSLVVFRKGYILCFPLVLCLNFQTVSPEKSMQFGTSMFIAAEVFFGMPFFCKQVFQNLIRRLFAHIITQQSGIESIPALIHCSQCSTGVISIHEIPIDDGLYSGMAEPDGILIPYLLVTSPSDFTAMPADYFLPCYQSMSSEKIVSVFVNKKQHLPKLERLFLIPLRGIFSSPLRKEKAPPLSRQSHKTFVPINIDCSRSVPGRIYCPETW